MHFVPFHRWFCKMGRMKLTRRKLLASSISVGLLGKSIAAKVGAAEKQPVPAATGMRLGSVTYNIAKDWDVPSIIKNLTATGFEGVELRTTYAHGVEVSLSKQERAEVKKRFADSKVE